MTENEINIQSVKYQHGMGARGKLFLGGKSLTFFVSIESVMPSKHLILCGPLLLLPPIPPSIRVFSNESTLRLFA